MKLIRPDCSAEGRVSLVFGVTVNCGQNETMSTRARHEATKLDCNAGQLSTIFALECDEDVDDS